MTQPGSVIADRYRVVRQLGAGGMGVVWEAHDERLNRSIAIKQLRTQHGVTDAETEVITQRAIREARISARLQHPYAVSVFDVVEHEGKPCIVMELVPSMPLSEVMRELGSLVPQEAARMGAQVASALAAAHALGIVHRDIKPGNILIGDDGAARICDFGISRAYGDATLTMTGMITGTPAYLAPEAARGEESTYASDVFSLGATLYAAVEGEPPFGNDGNAIAVLYRVAAGELRQPERAGALAPLLLAMLNPDPASRPTMAEAAAQLSALADGRASAVPPGSAVSTAPTRVMPTPPAAESTPPPSATVALPQQPGLESPAEPAAGAPSPVPPSSVPPSSVPPANAQRADPAPTKRRRGLVAVLIVAVVAVVIAFAVLLPRLGQPSAEPSSDTPATTASSETSTEPSTDAPSQTPTSTPTTSEISAAELTKAVTDYYALLPDDTDAAWERLTPAYQSKTGGRKSYDSFWNSIDSVSVTSVKGTGATSVEAAITYVAKSGDATSSERRSFTLVKDGDVLKIDQSAVVG
ncbi:MAG: protein kinase [Microlunatus sp.]